ncbi:uncharacterized protein LOC131936126 [Physella acuta]|uniref:uncharacterized protein LOC131936126 n=1 Tax=Physella acuta TaxID=109671 RepID=UPI0027DB9EA6|nr:uncharacterized protein LOC131936126 [Physella acuta]
MASTSRMLRIFGRRLIEANNTVKPIQNIFFQKPKTNNVGTKCFVNSKLLHSQNRQEEAGGKLQYKTKSKWLQFGKLGLLVVASTTAAAGFTYLTLLKDVKAGFPEEESLVYHQATEEVDLEDNLLINEKVKVFTKDELKAFCEKNFDKLNLYAVSEKDMEDNKVSLREVSDDEYKKLMNENLDSSFKKGKEKLQLLEVA